MPPRSRMCRGGKHSAQAGTLLFWGNLTQAGFPTLQAGKTKKAAEQWWDSDLG